MAAASLLRRSPRLLAPAALLSLLCSSCTLSVRSTVHDLTGRPVPDAVVYATPRDKTPAPGWGRAKATVVMENLEFQPRVLPVRVGTGVSFLNRDDIKHQIYSISAAKNFELSANRLSSSAEVVFDKQGAVVLGCALHDRMIGHIYVLETPYFARTGADGTAELEGLPRNDSYTMRVWHPDMKASADAAARRVSGSSGRSVAVDFRVNVQHSRPQE